MMKKGTLIGTVNFTISLEVIVNEVEITKILEVNDIHSMRKKDPDEGMKILAPEGCVDGDEMSIPILQHYPCQRVLGRFVRQR